MNVFLQTQQLTRSVGDKTLFRDINISIAQGQKVGLIAQNGTGKSTLLNILSGHDTADSGEVVLRQGLRIGYLPQSPVYPEEMTVMEACFHHAQVDRDDTEEALQLEILSNQILGRLHITDTQQLIGRLSGGQLKRVALANVLIQQPDLLILDEPTNHLDLDMIEWLEGYLSRQNLTLLMVTHDRYFLDNVCNLILEMDNQTIYTYRGNYAYYLEKYQERIDNQRAEIQRANNLYRRELEWIRSTPQARSHKARYREEAFEEISQRAHQRISVDCIRLQNHGTYIGNKIFEAHDVSFAYGTNGSKVILKDFSYIFSRYEKLGIIGANGTGKSTFIKLLLGLIQPQGGHFQIGQTVRFGYFSQEPLQVDESMKVIDAVRRIAEYISFGEGQKMSAMQFLQHFLFSPQAQQNYIYKLSGGERRRLQLCLTLIRNPNFLVLDEPTNDMDILTLQVLEQYLIDFKGCQIIVSHDRYFMDKVVDHLLVFHGEGQITDFPGNYTQYRQNQKGSNDVNGSSSSNGSKHIQTTQTREKKRLTYREKLEFEQLGKDIEALESERATIHTAFSGATLTPEQITQYSKRLPELETELDTKSARWLELSEYA